MKPAYLTLAAALAIAAPAVPVAAEATELWRLDGFSLPESVAHDPASGKIFVSSIGTDPMSKKGDGFISVIDAEGNMVEKDWVTGLNSPKGMDVVDGTLYVTGVDELVAIDIATGAVTGTFASESQFLNDVAAAPDGRVFVSDTFANQVLVFQDGALSSWLQDPMLMGVNGLSVIDGKLIAADLGDASGGFENIKPGPVVSADLESKELSAYGAESVRGVFDGVEPDGQGGLILTDNGAGKVLRLMPGGELEELASPGAGAADHEVIADQGLILVPVMQQNTVVAYRLGE